MVPAHALGRLAREDEFRRVYREGARRSTALLVLHVRPNGLAVVRLGVAVARRLGRAVRRNRLRRRLREAVRAHARRIGAGADLVVVARDAAVKATYDDLYVAVATALSAAGLLEERAGGGR